MKKLDIEKLKYELKLINNEKVKDTQALVDLLLKFDNKLVNKYSGYLRSGLDFYINHFLDKYKEFLTFFYEKIQEEGELTCNLKITTNFFETINISKENLSEETFAKILLEKGYSIPFFIKKETPDEIKKESFKLIYQDEIDFGNKKILCKEKEFENISSFESLMSLKNEELISKLIFVSTWDDYIQKVYNFAEENYDLSYIKKIINSSEHEKAFFAVGALIHLKGITGYSPTFIINNYEAMGFQEAFNRICVENKNIDDIFIKYNKYSDYKVFKDYHPVNEILKDYLIDVDWNDKKNIDFNFKILVEYLIITNISLIDKARLTKEEMNNYYSIVVKYLKSIPLEKLPVELSAINEFNVIKNISMPLNNAQNDSNANSSSNIEEMTINSYGLLYDFWSDLELNKIDSSYWCSLSLFDKYTSDLLTRAYNHDYFLHKENSVKNVYFSYPYVIVNIDFFRKKTLFDYDDIVNLLNISFNNYEVKMTNLGILAKIDKENITNFNNVDTPKELFKFLLKKGVNLINPEERFNNYYAEKKLNEKLEELDSNNSQKEKRVKKKI